MPKRKQRPKKLKCPKWLRAYSLKVKDALWLNEWHITLRMERLKGEEKRTEVTADCTPTTPYLSAIIRFHPDHFREPTPEAKTIVIHEYLHVVLGRTQRVADQAIEQLPKKMQTLAENARHDALEETIERLSRALYPLIEKIPDA